MFDDLGKGVFSMNLAKHVPAAAGDISAQLSVVLIRLCCVFRVTGHSSRRGGSWGHNGGRGADPRLTRATCHGRVSSEPRVTAPAASLPPPNCPR